MKQIVIDFLKEKRKEIEQKLMHISAVINLIENKGTDLRPFIENGNQEVEKRFRKLKSNDNYSHKSKLDQKIAYALTMLGSADKDAILNKILEVDKEFERYKLEKFLAVRLSYLLKNDKVIGVKSGRKYNYSLYDE